MIMLRLSMKLNCDIFVKIKAVNISTITLIARNTRFAINGDKVAIGVIIKTVVGGNGENLPLSAIPNS
jgi:hypothetical protein